MKKVIFILTLTTFLLFSLFSCTSSRAEKHDTKPPIVENESNWDFILINNVPHVNFEIDGQPLTFSVDTGCVTSQIYESALVKTSSLDEIMNLAERVYNDNKSDSAVEWNKLSDNARNNFIWHNGFTYTISIGDTDIPFYIALSQKSKDKDGVIGIDFLKKYSRVTFDYKEKIIKLDDDSLPDSCETPLIPIFDDNLYAINYSYNGVNEIGLIDTGNYKFTTRKNIGKAGTQKNDDEITRILSQNKKVVSYKIFHKKLKNISIGSVNYPEIDSVPSEIMFLNATNWAKIFCKYYTSIGYEVWKNHVIQLDFEDMIFRIAK